MIKRLFLIILVLYSYSVFAQSSEQLDKFLEFNYSLPELAVMTDDVINTLLDKFFVIKATVSEIIVENTDPENYLAYVVIDDGKWLSLSDIELYEGVLIFKGSEYAQVIPSRPPRNITPDLIVSNVSLLILGRFVSYEVVDDRIIPYFTVHKYRIDN